MEGIQARRRRAVSAAEKLDELLRTGEARPRCHCHGEVMHWWASESPKGGRWRCAVKERQRQRSRWAATSPTRRSWQSMVNRCTEPSNASWGRYGGRGVLVCDAWLPSKGGSFAQFLADMGERPEGTTLDRIDPYGDYEPGNCRWATPKEQRANRRKPRDEH